MQLDLTLQNPQNASPTETTWHNWITTWLTALNPTDPDDGLPLHPEHHYEICLRLTTDAEIQSLNQQFRAKDMPTDVLAFAALEGDNFLPEDDAEPLYLGDIVISVETAHIQAIEQHHSLEIELAWLASHGLLHLLGWDHPDNAQLAAMLAQQRSLLEGAGIITP
jgi:probable rRNA maturation factor